MLLWLLKPLEQCDISLLTWMQGCPWDVMSQDRDETETYHFPNFRNPDETSLFHKRLEAVSGPRLSRPDYSLQRCNCMKHAKSAVCVNRSASGEHRRCLRKCADPRRPVQFTLDRVSTKVLRSSRSPSPSSVSCPLRRSQLSWHHARYWKTATRCYSRYVC